MSYIRFMFCFIATMQNEYGDTGLVSALVIISERKIIPSNNN